jgi:hypothetical protein
MLGVLNFHAACSFRYFASLFFCGTVFRTKYDLHHPLSQLAVFQKGTYYAGIKVFNGLPGAIKELSHNTKQFKLALKNFLLFHSFYTLDEYFKYKN